MSRYMYAQYFFAVVSCKLFRDFLAGLNNTDLFIYLVYFSDTHKELGSARYMNALPKTKKLNN